MVRLGSGSNAIGSISSEFVVLLRDVAAEGCAPLCANVWVTHHLGNGHLGDVIKSIDKYAIWVIPPEVNSLNPCS